MRVLPVSADTKTINMRTGPLGAAMVAAATRGRNHEVGLVDLPLPRLHVEPAVDGFLHGTVASSGPSTPSAPRTPT